MGLGRNKIGINFPKSSSDSNLGLTWVEVDNQAWENYLRNKTRKMPLGTLKFALTLPRNERTNIPGMS